MGEYTLSHLQRDQLKARLYWTYQSKHKRDFDDGDRVEYWRECSKWVNQQYGILLRKILDEGKDFRDVLPPPSKLELRARESAEAEKENEKKRKKSGGLSWRDWRLGRRKSSKKKDK